MARGGSEVRLRREAHEINLACVRSRDSGRFTEFATSFRTHEQTISQEASDNAMR